MDIYLVQQIPWEFMIAVSILSGEKSKKWVGSHVMDFENRVEGMH